MTEDERKKLEDVFKRLERFEKDFQRKKMQDDQRNLKLGTLLLFSLATFAWLSGISFCPRFRPHSWPEIVSTITPALIWLGVATLVLRWLGAVR